MEKSKKFLSLGEFINLGVHRMDFSQAVKIIIRETDLLNLKDLEEWNQEQAHFPIPKQTELDKSKEQAPLLWTGFITEIQLHLRAR